MDPTQKHVRPYGNTFPHRQKSTISDDHGKNFHKHIAKYEDFINYPDHVNFQRVMDGCFNVYNPLEHEPLEDECTPEDCPNIIVHEAPIW
jgi:hypothetical protein